MAHRPPEKGHRLVLKSLCDFVFLQFFLVLSLFPLASLRLPEQGEVARAGFQVGEVGIIKVTLIHRRTD